jgi:hypothetical protein
MMREYPSRITYHVSQITYHGSHIDMLRRLDLRTFSLILGAALVGAGWAIYNRGLTSYPYGEDQFRSLVWVIFATPFATFWGWFVARRAERWWAALICFCIYFCAPFVAARYESCAVLRGSFSLSDCFVATTAAQQAASDTGHRIYFTAIVAIHVLAALVVALHRALSRSTMPAQFPLPGGEPSP